MDDWLVRRAQHRDPQAFQRLVELYEELAMRTARVLLRDRDLAEDVVQEAWLDAWRGLPGFQADRPFRPWLLMLVANRCRKAQRGWTPPTTALTPDDAGTLAAADDVSAALLQRERAAELRAALSKLSEEQQRVLELRYFAELELAEIASITALPLGTVKSRLHRALQAVRAEVLRVRATSLEQEEHA